MKVLQYCILTFSLNLVDCLNWRSLSRAEKVTICHRDFWLLILVQESIKTSSLSNWAKANKSMILKTQFTLTFWVVGCPFIKIWNLMWDIMNAQQRRSSICNISSGFFFCVTARVLQLKAVVAQVLHYTVFIVVFKSCILSRVVLSASLSLFTVTIHPHLGKGNSPWTQNTINTQSDTPTYKHKKTYYKLYILWGK